MWYPQMLNQIFTVFAKSLCVAILIYLVEYLSKVDFVINFFAGNLISLLSAMLAINIATLGIVLTRIATLKQSESSFLATKKQILLSLKEQIALIFLSLILSILSKKDRVGGYAEFLEHSIGILFLTIFVYAILVLYDTAKALINIH